jgi:hypothetical protein
VASSLEAVTQRWTVFLQKVEARLGEVEAEAREGLSELIATEVVDPAPLGNALQEVKARLRALVKKVDAAWSDTIEPECEELDPARVEKLRRAGEALNRRIEAAGETLEADARLQAAERLKVLAEAERAARKLVCAKCGAPLTEPEVLHRAENVTCMHCRAVNTVRPGLAMAMYFAGGVLQAKAKAVARGSDVRLKEAEQRFRARRHPSREDAEALRAATAAHWREVCLAKGRETPGWTEAKLEGEVKVKVSQAMKLREEREGHRWDAVSKVVALARAGDARGLVAWMNGEGGDLGFGSEEVLEVMAEREDARALETALGVAWQRDAPDEPKARWIAERRAELKR